MRPLRVLLADDHALMLEAIALALEDEREFEIVGRAESGSQVLPLVHQTQPDLIVLDLLMPGVDGLTCVKLLGKRFPWIRTVVLSAQDSDEVIDAVLHAGADAFVSKAVEPAALAAALREAMDKPMNGGFGRFVQSDHPAVEEKGLTKREMDVLRALAAGKSNKQIAHSLCLAEQTVKFHLTSIYRKLDVTGRTQAVHWAYHHGLVESEGTAARVAAMLDPSTDPRSGH
jgi:DNA-binding NarL/FixJ family response regulator